MTDIKHLKNKNLFYSDDVQETLNFLNENPEIRKTFEKIVLSKDYLGYDQDIILGCIKYNDADMFYNYDSDVLESYLSLFKTYILSNM